METHIVQADLADPRHAAAIVAVVNSYASDPVGGGQPLPRDVLERMVPALRAHPTTLVLLAFAGDEPIGIAVCFFGLSTFKAKPLLNIHDLAVVPSYRGKGLGRALLRGVEEHARRAGCCKLTLEVQDTNGRARALYQSFGFDDFVIDKPMPTRFLSKPL